MSNVIFISGPHRSGGRVYTIWAEILRLFLKDHSHRHVLADAIWELQLDHVVRDGAGLYELWRFGEDGIRFLDEEYADLGVALDGLIGEG